MDSQRNIIIIAFLLVSLIIWQVWNQDNQQYTHITSAINKDSLPIKTEFNSKRITVKTDVLELIINTLGGNIEQAKLLKYMKELGSNENFLLLETTPNFIYQAQCGITGLDGPDNPNNLEQPLYNVDKDNFILSKDQNELIIPMTYIDKIGNIFKKTFTMKRGEYAVRLNISIHNISKKSLELSSFGQLKQSILIPNNRDFNSNFALHTFRGAAYSTPDNKYEKYKFDIIKNNDQLDISAKRGWVAMLEQYFATAWVVPFFNDIINNFYTSKLDNGVVAIGYKSQPVIINPGKTIKFNSILWVGPKIQEQMANVAPYLDLTVDYGWLWFISQPMFKLLKFIYNFIGNWGLSIIVITFIVRGIMYPLTKSQYISMAKIRMLHPKIQAIRDRLGNDKQRISHEMIALYKAEKVNPFGGCFPLLIQMPIFLGLYYMLMSSVELRHAPFMLWIDDLSARDSYYILPIIMGITMFIIQNMSHSPTTTTVIYKNKHNKIIITIIPFIFALFFLWFPAGLVLYYIISNFVTIIQQQLIYRGLEKRGLFKK